MPEYLIQYGNFFFFDFAFVFAVKKKTYGKKKPGSHPDSCFLQMLLRNAEERKKWFASN